MAAIARARGLDDPGSGQNDDGDAGVDAVHNGFNFLRINGGFALP
jgi:hypothetical protein